MPRLVEKKVKLGRNDPCHCGSGKKYKDCHLPIEQAYRAEQMKLREAQETLLPRIMEAAQSVPAAFPVALERFWNGKYTHEQMSELDDLEDRGADRFLTWFAFDHRHDDGQTLVEQLASAAETGGFEADEYELRLLRNWTGVRLRPYVIEDLRKGQNMTLRDLLDEGTYLLADQAAAKRLEPGEVVVGHIVPADTPLGAAAPTFYLAGAAAQLTADTAEKLLEFAGLYLTDLQRTQPDATWSDLLRERSYVLNHFVMALPREEYNPTLLDNLILEARVTLHLTGEALSGLVRRDRSTDEKTDAAPAHESRE